MAAARNRTGRSPMDDGKIRVLMRQVAEVFGGVPTQARWNAAGYGVCARTVARRLGGGSWRRAWAAAGVPAGRYLRRTDGEILAVLREERLRRGGVPKVREYEREVGSPSVRVLRERFGSWGRAWRLAVEEPE